MESAGCEPVPPCPSLVHRDRSGNARLYPPNRAGRHVAGLRPCRALPGRVRLPPSTLGRQKRPGRHPFATRRRIDAVAHRRRPWPTAAWAAARIIGSACGWSRRCGNGHACLRSARPDSDAGRAGDKATPDPNARRPRAGTRSRRGLRAVARLRPSRSRPPRPMPCRCPGRAGRARSPHHIAPSLGRRRHRRASNRGSASRRRTGSVGSACRLESRRPLSQEPASCPWTVRHRGHCSARSW